MRLTLFTDYALRSLMYAAHHANRLVTIEETASAYGISRAHMMKVAHQLTREGYLVSERGRAGGLRLAMPPARINVGQIVRLTEPDLHLVTCFENPANCPITPSCRLKTALGAALGAFLKELDRHTLADLRPADLDFSSLSAEPVRRPTR